MRSKAAMGVADVLVHKEYPKYIVNSEVKNKISLEESTPQERYSQLV
jgi:D-3-phosphoglycerate dehydrogenase